MYKIKTLISLEVLLVIAEMSSASETTKTIRVSDDVHTMLVVEKARGDYRTMNDVIADIIDLE